MIDVPRATAEAMPEEEPIVTAAVLLLLHVPPLVVLVNVVVVPMHIFGEPPMAGARLFTVTTDVVWHPFIT